MNSHAVVCTVRQYCNGITIASVTYHEHHFTHTVSFVNLDAQAQEAILCTAGDESSSSVAQAHMQTPRRAPTHTTQHTPAKHATRAPTQLTRTDQMQARTVAIAPISFLASVDAVNVPLTAVLVRDARNFYKNLF